VSPIRRSTSGATFSHTNCTKCRLLITPATQAKPAEPVTTSPTPPAKASVPGFAPPAPKVKTTEKDTTTVAVTTTDTSASVSADASVVVEVATDAADAVSVEDGEKAVEIAPPAPAPRRLL
jgi:hypothetical protein